MELKELPCFVGGQFHPELKSKPLARHPLFSRFVRAACERKAMPAREGPRSGTEAQPHAS
ncbi:hypothetical protein BH11MYX4_BH11MYX4_44550 [soil metagenome]